VGGPFQPERSPPATPLRTELAKGLKDGVTEAAPAANAPLGPPPQSFGVHGKRAHRGGGGLGGWRHCLCEEGAATGGGGRGGRGGGSFGGRVYGVARLWWGRAEGGWGAGAAEGPVTGGGHTPYVCRHPTTRHLKKRVATKSQYNRPPRSRCRRQQCTDPRMTSTRGRGGTQGGRAAFARAAKRGYSVWGRRTLRPEIIGWQATLTS